MSGSPRAAQRPRPSTVRRIPLPLLASLGVAVAGCAPAICFHDLDGDGFGWSTPYIDTTGACGSRPGETLDGTDCDDSNPDVRPGVEEVPADGIDQDCDGVDLVYCLVDLDGDGWGIPGEVVDPDGSCYDAGQSPASTVGDCDDDDPAVHPNAEDLPGDGVDQDCNDVDAAECWYDGDDDGYGAPVTAVDLDGDCDDDPFQTSVPGDCDDSADWRHPGAWDEPGDFWDADCDGIDPAVCYADGDADGFGTGDPVVDSDGDCAEPGLSAVAGDCDDQDDTTRPGAWDPPGDGVDQDCDGVP